MLDYIQRIRPPGHHADRRGSVDASMDYLRQFSDAGCGLIVVAAVGRTKDKSGRSSYSGDKLNLASFRESSELEFGADNAFILVPGDFDGVTLRHLKSRHGECRDVPLRFDMARQSFEPTGALPTNSADTAGKLQAALQSLWETTEAADDDAPEGFAEFEDYA